MHAIHTAFEHHDDYRAYRQRQHRQHRGKAGRGRRLRRGAQQQPGTRDALRPGRELGPRARAATAAEAAEAAEIVVVTVPLKNYRQVPVEPLRGKVVIDTNNYYPERDGHIAELDDESTTTSELLQAHLADAHVVKGFNNIYVDHLATLARPAGDPDRPRSPSQAMTTRPSRPSPVPRCHRIRHPRRRAARRRMALPARHQRLRDPVRGPRHHVPRLVSATHHTRHAAGRSRCSAALPRHVIAGASRDAR